MDLWIYRGWRLGLNCRTDVPVNQTERGKAKAQADKTGKEANIHSRNVAAG